MRQYKSKDLTGQKFFRLTALYRTENFVSKNGTSRVVWHCRCDCGNEVDVMSQNLINGSTKSCGCYNREAAFQRNFISLEGQRFGKLVVISQADFRIKPDGTKEYRWLCKCDCGNRTIVSTSSLRTGNTKSCGCIQKEKATEHIVSINKSHGDCYSRLYSIWSNMLFRCKCETASEYKYYGGRGISVCEEWCEYSAFKEWAMANNYSEELTIDRIDVNGNYCPENCRWATKLQQANNKTSNRYLLTPDGKYLSMADCSRKYNIPYYTLRSRIHRGWDDIRALTTPLLTKSKEVVKDEKIC